MNKNAEAARERRRRYAELRDDGMDPSTAAARVGVPSHGSADRYERWYRASKAPAAQSSGSGGAAGEAAS